MSRKLLLADDSITIQKVIGITFVNEDFDLSVVDNGDSALERARADRPDLILADVFMPGKNGYELCAAVKSDPALAGVPVLLLTGTFEPFDEAKANSVGADGWIAKPFESQTLIRRVKELLDKASAAPVISVALPEIAESVPETSAEADLWEDFDQVKPAVDVTSSVDVVESQPDDADFGDIFGPGEDVSPAETTADDIWGDVSFEDEDLAAETEVVKGSDLDDIWAPDEEVASEPLAPVAEEDADVFAFEPAAEPEIEEPSGAEPEKDDLFIFEEEEEVAAVASAETSADDELMVFEEEPLVETPETVESAEEELMELGEDDILLLDEAEILDDEDLDLEPVSEELEDDFLFVDEVDEGVPADLRHESSLDDEDLFGDIVETAQPEPVIPEPEPVIPEPEPVIPEPEPVIPEPEPVIPEPEPVIPEPEPVIPAVVPSAETVEARVQSISDEELEAIVEKVAGAVIERLAGTILERIAWEVVPDLAESLIKEEIRQIKENAR